MEEEKGSERENKIKKSSYKSWRKRESEGKKRKVSSYILKPSVLTSRGREKYILQISFVRQKCYCS